jgi:hypothetical protein
MKVGEIYVCGDCGLELQVVKACGDGEHGDACSMEASSCALRCCDEDLVLKE